MPGARSPLSLRVPYGAMSPLSEGPWGRSRRQAPWPATPHPPESWGPSRACGWPGRPNSSPLACRRWCSPHWWSWPWPWCPSCCSARRCSCAGSTAAARGDAPTTSRWGSAGGAAGGAGCCQAGSPPSPPHGLPEWRRAVGEWQCGPVGGRGLLMLLAPHSPPG